MATPWITSYTVNFQNTRNDFGGGLGARFTVGGSNITISALGRWKISGNSQTHTVYILNTSGTMIVSASCDMTLGSAGGFVYTAISDTVLTSGVDYHLLSLEFASGDIWWDPNTQSNAYSTFDTTSAAFVVSSVQTGGPGNSIGNGWLGEPYVPPNMLIGAGAAGGGSLPHKRKSYSSDIARFQKEPKGYTKRNHIYVPNWLAKAA